MKSRPPKIAQMLLRQFLPDHIGPNGLGDYEELFHELVEENGKFRAHIWYWIQILKSMPRAITENIYWSTAMVKNYLKIAFRNLKKSPGFTLINISGIAFGITLFIFVYSVFDWQLSYDRFHKDANNIYSIIQVNSERNNQEFHTSYVQAKLEKSLHEEFSNIQESTKWIEAPTNVVKYGDKIFYEGLGKYVDPNFFSFFSFKLLKGKPDEVLSEPYSVVLTLKTAEKYFGDENPIGKYLTFNDNQNYKVTGLCEDRPLQSSLDYTMLISLNSIDIENNPEWKGIIYIKIQNSNDRQNIDERFPSFIKKHFAEAPTAPKEFYLLPLVEQFTYSQIDDAGWYITEPSILYFILGLGIALLVILSINFMNLTTARYMLRSKEIGMRKVVGARKFQLRYQFIGESLLTTILAFPFAIIMFRFVEIGFLHLFEGSPWVNSDFSVLNYPWLLVKLFFVTILLGLFSGSYPAFFLSKLDPINALKSTNTKGRKGGRTRKFLVVSQYTFSVGLIIFAIVTTNHFDYVANLDMGYSRANQIAIPLKSDEARRFIEPIKNSLLENPSVINVTTATQIPPTWPEKKKVIPVGEDESKMIQLQVYGIGYNYIESLELKLLDGRSFSELYADSSSFILNKKAVESFGWSNPIGQKITVDGVEGTIIGVVNDFHYKNIHFKIAPALFYLENNSPNYLLIKHASNQEKVVLDYTKTIFHDILPNEPFESTTLEAKFEREYQAFDVLASLLMVISIIAVVFSCLGILGLASYSVQNKIKEIGVRKVLGASVSMIINTLIWDFLRLVLIANLIACPLAYFGVRKFFEFGWSYPSDVGAEVFIFTIALTVATTIAAVFFQTYKAATANPTESLRSE